MLQDYLDQIWDAFKEGICITDAQGTILHLNQRHSELTGISREKLIGRPAMEFVRRGVLDVVLNPEVVATKQPATLVQTVSNGRKVILEGNPVFDQQGNVALCITFIRDVTTLSQLREQLLLQKELLETFQHLSSTRGTQELFKKTPKIFSSAAMQKMYREVNSIAETDASVLLLGETGVGKDVIARRLHELSQRKDKTFIKVDCGSIPDKLIETELFGYAAGTFSGGNKNGKIGLIEAASEGTLFLDEIGELPIHVQTCLLRFLQDREIVRVGSTTAKQVDVRIVAATNKNLEDAVNTGQFRSDLYYRLKVAVISIPPLRDRQADILPLARMFLDFYSDKYHRRLTFSEEAEQLLRAYKWPGNVRELENMVQGLAVTCKKGVIEPQDIPISGVCGKSSRQQNASTELASNFEGKTFKEVMKHLESTVLVAAMQRYGTITEVAKQLRVDRSTIFRKVKQLEKQGVKF
jgi:PAS domain S-box-containing protein